MAKNEGRNEIQLGQNVTSWQEGTRVCFAIDLAVTGHQSEGSKGLDKKGNPKTPNELVGTTRSYAPVADGRVLLHYIRPMKVEDVRRARAMAEIGDEDASIEKAKAMLAAAGVDVSGLASS